MAAHAAKSTGPAPFLLLLLLTIQAAGCAAGRSMPGLSWLNLPVGSTLPAPSMAAAGTAQPSSPPLSQLELTDAASGHGAAAQAQGRVEMRVLEGQPASEEDFGFMAALVGREDNETFCGGALLDNATVLTAAHCVVDERGQPFHPLTFWVEVVGVRYPPNRVLPHPGYNVSALEADERDDVIAAPLHDIAVVKLALPVEEAAAVQLPAADLELQPGQLLEVAGWGKTSDAGNESDVLLFAEVDLIADAACPIVPYKDTICAGNEESGARTCRGDSGSPLVLRHADTGEATVVGIVAFSPTSCTPDMPYTRYTDVRQYLDCIEEWSSPEAWPIPGETCGPRAAR